MAARTAQPQQFRGLFDLAIDGRGILAGNAVGLSVGGMTVLGVLAASASYIAAPASIRASLPEANVGRCITAALGFTFPFNLAIGIPLYAAMAHWLSA